MNEVTLLLSVYGAAMYAIIGLGIFGAVSSSWTNPWPGDKAFALAVLWLPCFVLFLAKSLITGVIKLTKDFVK